MSRTSRYPLRSMNGLPISDIQLTWDSTCQRNVACAAGLSSWWWVSETRPGLSIPSRNTDRGMKADSDFLHRSTPSNLLRSTRTAGVAVYVNYVPSTLIISLCSKEILYSAKKKQVQRHKCPYIKRGYIEFKYYANAIHSGLTPPG